MSEPQTKLTLAARKNIKEYEPMINESLEQIKKNLGLKELTLDVDYLEYENVTNAKQTGYENRPAWGVSNYLEGLAQNTQGLEGDELTMEAVNETLGETAVVKFVFLKEGSATGKIELEKGIINIVNTPEGIGANQCYLGENFESLL